jgi:hypothetical protein
MVEYHDEEKPCRSAITSEDAGKNVIIRGEFSSLSNARRPKSQNTNKGRTCALLHASVGWLEQFTDSQADQLAICFD